MIVEQFVKSVRKAIEIVAGFPLGTIYLAPDLKANIGIVRTLDTGIENTNAQKLKNGAVIPTGTTVEISGKNIIGNDIVFTVKDIIDEEAPKRGNKAVSKEGEIFYRSAIIYLKPDSSHPKSVIKEIPLFGNAEWLPLPDE